jgi:hypothetical protein
MPLVQFLAEEVGLGSQQNLGTLNLPQVEALGLSLIPCRQNGVAVCRNMIPERLGIFDNLPQKLLLLRLEGQTRNLVVPLGEVFKARSRSVSRYFHSPITYGTCILVFLLDLPTGDLQTFAMVPGPG